MYESQNMDRYDDNENLANSFSHLTHFKEEDELNNTKKLCLTEFLNFVDNTDCLDVSNIQKTLASDKILNGSSRVKSDSQVIKNLCNNLHTSVHMKKEIVVIILSRMESMPNPIGIVINATRICVLKNQSSVGLSCIIGCKIIQHQARIHFDNKITYRFIIYYLLIILISYKSILYL